MPWPIEKRLVLHCGANKTGTTVTQVACYSARDALAKAGVLFPDLGAEGMAARSHWPLTLAFRDAPEDYYAMKDKGYDAGATRDYADRIIASFERQVAEFTGPAVFVSTEATGQMKRPELERFIRYLDSRFSKIEAVYYAREPDAGIMSFLQELLKAGHEVGISDFLYQRNMNFGETARKLVDMLGYRINFRIFDRATLRDGDILTDILCDIVGLDALPPEVGQKEPNASLSARGAAFLYFLNRTVKRRGPDGLDPDFVLSRAFAESFTRDNPKLPKLGFPAESWKAAVRAQMQDDWLMFLKIAGFPGKERLFRARLAEDLRLGLLRKQPTQEELELWMQENFRGFPYHAMPAELRPALQAGLAKSGQTLASLS